jgi:hypothetical protein
MPKSGGRRSASGPRSGRGAGTREELAAGTMTSAQDVCLEFQRGGRELGAWGANVRTQLRKRMRTCLGFAPVPPPSPPDPPFPGGCSDSTTVLTVCRSLHRWASAFLGWAANCTAYIHAMQLLAASGRRCPRCARAVDQMWQDLLQVAPPVRNPPCPDNADDLLADYERWGHAFARWGLALITAYECVGEGCNCLGPKKDGITPPPSPPYY